MCEVWALDRIICLVLVRWLLIHKFCANSRVFFILLSLHTCPAFFCGRFGSQAGVYDQGPQLHAFRREFNYKHSCAHTIYSPLPAISLRWTRWDLRPFNRTVVQHGWEAVRSPCLCVERKCDNFSIEGLFGSWHPSQTENELGRDAILEILSTTV